MAWRVEIHPQVEKWMTTLPAVDQAKLIRQFDRLRESGPTLGRPHADTIVNRRHPNMKELRVTRPPLRALFAFDRERRAIVLTAGRKTGKREWYRTNVATANRRLDDHLATRGREPAWRESRAGTRSVVRSGSTKSSLQR